MTITLAPCPHCGGKTVAGWAIPPETWDVRACRQVECDAEPDTCGYCGPFDLTMEGAVRKHNKISQNTGGCQ